MVLIFTEVVTEQIRQIVIYDEEVVVMVRELYLPTMMKGDDRV